ncbi:hypothetical protein ETD86_24215 [Nonomuraea turkmeniaca]|uniref:Uncharacterized protein n=1 Tax=Nonomuraea turkmeniaca TaxID=103838 RepID=A0A5S4FFF9_9ACTN|nr:hypothetical protein [Nonomuraea turkmeniaca]TMR16759.1 hypothetical protein ETD86_24215 [Nonomuraea turkmeniaca]
MTDLANEKADAGPDQSEMHVNNHAPVTNQQNIENFYSGNRSPKEHLRAARRSLSERQWSQACQHYADYLKHEPASPNKKKAEVRAEYAFAKLQGRRPRAHPDRAQNEIHALLARACELDPESMAATALMAIFNEDLDHAFLRDGGSSDDAQRAGADLDLKWARRIVTAISVRESPTWQALDERVTPGGTVPIRVPELSEEEQTEREHRMRTLFTPAPAAPVREPSLNPVYGLLPLAGGGAIIYVAIALLATYEDSLRSAFSPAPYIGALGVATISLGAFLTFRALFANWHHHRLFRRAMADYAERRRDYEASLPTEQQITRWLKHDVDVIVQRALTRLGIVMEELHNTGRITDPLVIVGPADPPKTKLVRHFKVGEGYIASRYTVFVVCMADQKLGAYRTTLDSITGKREPEEQTSEYRYRDIVSVNVRTVRLDLPSDARRTEDAEPTYAFVDAQEKDTVAERFTLIVPGDRFTVTTKVSTDDEKTSRIDFSRADRALAAIRRRIAASTGPV